MKKRIFYHIALISVILTILSPLPLYSQPSQIIEIDANAVINIDLSIYNNNLGLVRELRDTALPAGHSELRLIDIPAQIKPSSVIVTSQNLTGGLEILEQSYEYDLINPQKLMDKYVGKKLKLVKEIKETGEEKELEAELISNNNGYIYRIGTQIHIGHPGRVVLPEIPDDLIVKPALVWELKTQEDGKYPLEIVYLTEGLDWETDYSLILNSEETRGDMSGWVTIKNKTGVSYKNANIQLVAGDINRVYETQKRRVKMADAYSAMAEGVTEEGIFEYHLYTLPGKYTLKHNQTKQVKLLNAERIPIKKELRYYGDERLYHSRYAKTENYKNIGVYLEFENKKTFHLGIPLPGGIIRSYKKDSKGLIQFLGEDSISHIPEDGKVKLKIGNAFDITAEKKQIDWQKVSTDILEVKWEIIFKNSKNESVWIVVLESIPGDWEVMETTHHWKKEDAHTLRFDVSITPKGEEKIQYKVRIKI